MARSWMGADQYGRHACGRVVHGVGISLVVGLISVGIAATTGTAVGSCGGAMALMLEYGAGRCAKGESWTADKLGR